MRSAQTTLVEVRGTLMGYYDFNDHFWSPYEACKQKSALVEQQEQLSLMDKFHNWLRSLRHKNIDISEQHNKLEPPKS